MSWNLRGRILLLTGLVALVSIVTGLPGGARPASAEEEDYGRNGLYLGLGMAVGSPTWKSSVIESYAPPPADPDATRADAAVGIDGRVGWRLFRHLALEAEAEYLPGIQVKIQNDEVVRDAWTVSATANGKGYVLAEGPVQPFLLFGVGYMRTNADLSDGSEERRDGWALRAGLGLDAYVSRNWAIALDASYLVPVSHTAVDRDYISVNLGVQYAF